MAATSKTRITTGHQQQPSLRVVTVQIVVGLAVQAVEVVALTRYLLGLQQQYVGILTGDEGRPQLFLTCVRLLGQYLHGQFHYLVAVRRIDIRRFEQSVAHLFESAATCGQRVDATEACRGL